MVRWPMIRRFHPAAADVMGGGSVPVGDTVSTSGLSMRERPRLSNPLNPSNLRLW